MKDVLAPRSHAEATAVFRAQLVGPLLSRELARGELQAELRRISSQRYRPPGSNVTRCYAVSTLERWYYTYRNKGLEALQPRRRNDAGHARTLTDEQRDLLCNIRRVHPSASAELILRSLVLEGRIEADAVSATTVRRLFRSEGLRRLSRKQQHDHSARRRWQAE